MFKLFVVLHGKRHVSEWNTELAAVDSIHATARKYGYSLLVAVDKDGADQSSWTLVRMSDNTTVGAAYVAKAV